MHKLRLKGDERFCENNEVTVSGWVRSVRGQKGVCFVTIHDGTNLHGMQTMFDTTICSEDVLNISKTLTVGSAVSVVGKMVRNPRKDESSQEAYEVWATSITIHGMCAADKDVKPEKEAKISKKKTDETAPAPVATNPFGLPGYALTKYPLQKKYQSLEFLRENSSLKMRTNTYSAVFRVRNAVRVIEVD